MNWTMIYFNSRNEINAICLEEEKSIRMFFKLSQKRFRRVIEYDCLQITRQEKRRREEREKRTNEREKIPRH